MYEVYLRAWNSGVNIATIFKSDDLKECQNFADKWNAFKDDIQKGKILMTYIYSLQMFMM